MIEIKNISYTFQRGNPNEIKAISNLSLSIETGEFLVLIGANGSGKSTLLNLIAGNFIPQEGTIFIEGKECTKLKEHHRSKWIARLFQNPLLGTAPDLSIIENFRLASLRTKSKGLRIGTGNKFRSEVKEYISQLELGLETKLDQTMGTLSGGQRQALTLSMAVMDKAKILLMDEPTAALDPKTSEIFMRISERIIKEHNLTTILITHQLKDALIYGRRLIQMDEGQIIRDLGEKNKDKLTLIELFSWFGV